MRRKLTTITKPANKKRDTRFYTLRIITYHQKCLCIHVHNIKRKENVRIYEGKTIEIMIQKIHYTRTYNNEKKNPTNIREIKHIIVLLMLYGLYCNFY